MKIPFGRVHDDIGNRTGKIEDPLSHEIFSTVAHQTWAKEGNKDGMVAFWDKARERGHFNVSIMIDGKEFNPELLNRVFDELDKMVDRKAMELAEDKVKDALNEAEILNEIVRDAGANLIEKFNLNLEDYER